MKSSKYIFSVLLLGSLLLETASGDPAFWCTEIDGFQSMKNFDEYKQCGKDCDCNMFELMCLEK